MRWTARPRQAAKPEKRTSWPHPTNPDILYDLHFAWFPRRCLKCHITDPNNTHEWVFWENYLMQYRKGRILLEGVGSMPGWIKQYPVVLETVPETSDPPFYKPESPLNPEDFA